MSTPIVLEAILGKCAQTKNGYSVTFLLNKDQIHEIQNLSPLGKEPLSIIVVLTEEFKALEGDLH